MKIGEKLREIRIKNKLSMNGLALYFGVRPETIKDWENEVETIPTRILQEYARIKENKGREVKQWLKNRTDLMCLRRED